MEAYIYNRSTPTQNLPHSMKSYCLVLIYVKLFECERFDFSPYRIYFVLTTSRKTQVLNIFLMSHTSLSCNLLVLHHMNILDLLSRH